MGLGSLPLITWFSQTLFTCNSHTQQRGGVSPAVGTVIPPQLREVRPYTDIRGYGLTCPGPYNRQYEPSSDFVDFTPTPPGGTFEPITRNIVQRRRRTQHHILPQRGRFERSLTTDIPRTKSFHGDPRFIMFLALSTATLDSEDVSAFSSSPPQASEGLMTGVHCSWDDVDGRDVMCGRTLPVLPDILMLGFLQRGIRRSDSARRLPRHALNWGCAPHTFQAPEVRERQPPQLAPFCLRPQPRVKK